VRLWNVAEQLELIISETEISRFEGKKILQSFVIAIESNWEEFEFSSRIKRELGGNSDKEYYASIDTKIGAHWSEGGSRILALINVVSFWKNFDWKQ
jgi:hypothetical protein